MQTSQSTGFIRITKIPDSEAPLEIRKAWVGLILPCDPYLGYPDEGSEHGVLSKKETPHNRCSFSVPQDQAIDILGKKNPRAAAWWRQQGFPQAGGRFGFSEDEAKIVNGVTHQRIIEVTEDMRGHPSR